MSDTPDIQNLPEINVIDDLDEFVLLDKSITNGEDADEEGRVSKVGFNSLGST